jgi:hypothetical protein
MKFGILQPAADWKTALGFQSRWKIRLSGSFRLILGLSIHAGRGYIRSTRDSPMPSSDPTPATSVSEVLKQAAATVYCRPAIRALGDSRRLRETIHSGTRASILSFPSSDSPKASDRNPPGSGTGTERDGFFPWTQECGSGGAFRSFVASHQSLAFADQFFAPRVDIAELCGDLMEVVNLLEIVSEGYLTCQSNRGQNVKDSEIFSIQIVVRFPYCLLGKYFGPYKPVWRF